MKKIFFLTGLLLMLFFKSYSQKAEDIIGFWLTMNEKTNEPMSQVQIYKDQNGKFYGKIVWLRKPDKNNKPLVDENNPDVKQRKNQVLGLQILKDVVFTKKYWENGTIYDPKSGNAYKCKLWFENNEKNILHLRGFIGISMIGRSTQWKREDKKR